MLAVGGLVPTGRIAAEPAEAAESVAPVAPGTTPDAVSEASRDAGEVVDALHEMLVGVMQRADELGFDGRYERIDPVLRDLFDLDFMAAKTVGRHWRRLETDDRRRLLETFAQFTISTYAGRFNGFGGESFERVSTTEAPRDRRYVRTMLHRPDDEDLEINYLLHERGGRWRIIDVLLRGTVSELALRRSEYTSVIARDGFEALLANLQEKIGDLARGEATEAS